jgi:MoaA/NifB/PqqE/SkfB family radical SAM enzyme
MRGSHGWAEITLEDKRKLIEHIVNGTPPSGPFHIELDLTDRCNVDCYFCNAMDVRTKEQIPYERIVEIIDASVPNGLRSVRFAGGGDPLFHREIDQVIDYVHSKGIVIDNITTNGLALSHSVAERLVRGKTREIVISLNAANAADYERMMQVKPVVFDKVIANVQHLVAIRGDSPHPAVIVQFLLDRENYAQLPQMYALGRRIGADFVAVNVVTEIPLDRIDQNLLLVAKDSELLRSGLREVIGADRDKHLLLIAFAFPEMQAIVTEIERELATSMTPAFVTAPSFREQNGQCFFGYYSAVVRGNGDLYPCCMLIKPDYKPLGNASRGEFIEDHWKGPEFNQLRQEMREVTLAGTEIEYQEGKFQTLEPQCVNAHACGLKNMFFRSDEQFYRELGEALDEARRREIRLTGNRQQLARSLYRAKMRHPRLKRAYDKVMTWSPALRRWIKSALGVRMSSAS